MRSMKIPKYILKKIERRRKAGLLMQKLDVEIMKWCENNGIELDAGGGIFENDIYAFNSFMQMTEPDAYAKGQTEIIEEKLKKRNR